MFELTSSKMGSYPARSAYEDSGIDFFLKHLSDIIWARFKCIYFCVFLYTFFFCLKSVWAMYHYNDVSFFANSNNIGTSQQNYRILGSLQQSEVCPNTIIHNHEDPPLVVGGSQTLNEPNHCWVSFWGLSTINHYPFLTITIICPLISINTSGFVVLLWTINNHH